jgi:hypothetical protein
MTPPQKKQGSALGKGLDALIRKDYLEEEGEKSEEKFEEEEVSEAPQVKTTEKAEEVKTPKTAELDRDEKIIKEVLEEVRKNPRISLWSARSAAVLRFLKKTKPEFSISNEASHLIEAAVKDKYSDIWEMFEEWKP